MNIYEEIINELCEMYSIPKIPVIIVPKGELKDAQAYFHSDDYDIHIEEGAPYLTILHEWTHYCLRLWKVTHDLEESICDFASVGIEYDALNEYPRLQRMISTLPREKGDDPETPEDTDPERLDGV